MKGRPAASDPNVYWEVGIPASLAAKVELALYDPVFGKIRYGARAELIQRLLAQWLEERRPQRAEERTNDDNTRKSGNATV